MERHFSRANLNITESKSDSVSHSSPPATPTRSQGHLSRSSRHSSWLQVPPTYVEGSQGLQQQPATIPVHDHRGRGIAGQSIALKTLPMQPSSYSYPAPVDSDQALIDSDLTQIDSDPALIDWIRQR